jgi:hypothetical protein
MGNCYPNYETSQKSDMKKAIIVGSGAGGATVAKELQGKLDAAFPIKIKGFYEPCLAGDRQLQS